MALRATTAQKSIKDPALIKMFNQMIGQGEPDPTIVIPKIQRMIKCGEDILGILRNFCKSPVYKAFVQQFPRAFEEIEKFIQMGEIDLKAAVVEKNDGTMRGAALNKINRDPRLLEQALMGMSLEYKTEGLGDKYKKFRDSYVLKEFIMTARNVRRELAMEKERRKADKHDLEDQAGLSNSFIQNADGDFLRLFSFSVLDFKLLYCSDIMNKELDKYILLSLHLLYRKLSIIVAEINKPDIDVGKFATILVDHIDSLRKQIPGCDLAFDKIKQSVDLLKNNFGEYHKDFIISANASVIIEHFVRDVSANAGGDARLAMQFKKITEFYSSRMKTRETSSDVEKIFSLLRSNLDMVDETSSVKA